MKKVMVFLLIFFSVAAYGQHTFNSSLKRQLDSVMLLDQKYRDTLMLLMDPQRNDSTAKSLNMTLNAANRYYWGLQNNIDSLNVVFIELVFKKYGYPGKSLVDTPANEAAWYIIQHSKKISQYIPLMKKAAEQKEIPFHLYAMMLDRDLMNQGKEQLYGTQVTCRKFKNIKDECIVWPIEDPANVNDRRKKAGFPNTVEDNANKLGVTYRVIKLSDVE